MSGNMLPVKKIYRKKHNRYIGTYKYSKEDTEWLLRVITAYNNNSFTSFLRVWCEGPRKMKALINIFRRILCKVLKDVGVDDQEIYSMLHTKLDFYNNQTFTEIEKKIVEELKKLANVDRHDDYCKHNKKEEEPCKCTDSPCEGGCKRKCFDHAGIKTFLSDFFMEAPVVKRRRRRLYGCI